MASFFFDEVDDAAEGGAAEAEVGGFVELPLDVAGQPSLPGGRGGNVPGGGAEALAHALNLQEEGGGEFARAHLEDGFFEDGGPSRKSRMAASSVRVRAGGRVAGEAFEGAVGRRCEGAGVELRAGGAGGGPCRGGSGGRSGRGRRGSCGIA